MLTIPTIGWVAKLGPGRTNLSSFSVAKYGAQQYTDYWMPDAGNGAHADGSLITGNAPTDADVPDSVDVEAGWINHLVGKWGTAATGGLKYYILDNEPSIWHSTHRDVHPSGATMAEVENDIVTYGAKVKAADPSAQVVAPEEWGWAGYLYSGADQQYANANGWGATMPDRTAHGGMDYLPWLLQQVQQHDQASGQRTLDVFSLHFYPQAGEYSDTVTDSMALMRNRSTRQLWDPAYTSESWIGTQVQLIPRMKGWVNTYYPGTKTAITEYNWGAEGNINGATTQADIYGIFGREGLDMATRWTVPAANSPVYLAMKMFRNYDGSKSGFGDTSISDTAPNPDEVSSFAALRSSDGAMTVVVINKDLYATAPVTVNLANFQAGATAQAWQLTSANAITRLADAPVTAGALTETLPAQSITLFVIAPAATAPPLPPATPPPPPVTSPPPAPVTPPPAPVTPPAAPQPVTLPAVADTYVAGAAAAGKHFGAPTMLIVKKFTTKPNTLNRVTYLKFDLTGVTTAPATATLTLTLAGSTPARSKAVCKIYGISGSAWNENTLTWNVAASAGANSEQLNNDTSSSGTLAATATVGPALGVYTWDLSAYLKDKAGQMVTLQLIDDTADGVYSAFNSRTADSGKPSLKLTF